MVSMIRYIKNYKYLNQQSRNGDGHNATLKLFYFYGVRFPQKLKNRSKDIIWNGEMVDRLDYA
jgi:hypothetical protein